MTFRTFLAGVTLAFAATAGLSSVHAETLKVGSTSTGVPFTFLDIKTRKIQGMMVDVIHAVGEKAGFTPDVSAVDFASLIPSLRSNRIDIISAAMLSTPTRAKVIDFSDPVFPYGEGLIVKKDDDTDYAEDLTRTEGKVIGAQQGTIYLEQLRKMDGIGEIRVYDSLADLMREAQLGRIDVGMGDKPIMAYQMSQGKYDGLKFANGYESQFGGSISLGVRKGDKALLARIDKALATLKDNGEIDRLAKKWGLE
ncbi:ABC transporter substrate-binding protein [Salinisphaera aquimarina]|uniref:ABC transporter substrate-binding protein n=1 Tax=Salinisphaera aquimarina TaxID=2094031 RepID=A0ABV7EV33_9GAMM